jgi:hypothetical protein
MLCFLAVLLPLLQTTPDFLRVEARFEPDSKEVQVVADLTLGPVSQPEIAFYINKSFALAEVSGEGVRRHEVRPGSSFLDQMCQRLVLQLDPTVAEKTVRFRYGGPLERAFEEDWIEVFADRAWVPLHESFGRTFFYEASIELPEGYLLKGMGRTEFREGRWAIRSTIPGMGLPFVASTSLKERPHKRGERTVHIVGRDLAGLPEQAIAEIAHDILDRYHGRFGQLKPQEQVTLVFRDFAGLPGYARPGYIVMQLLDDFEERRQEYSRYFAHELAHLWWHRGHSGSYENWLNEGFAEYSSLRTLRDFMGEEAFSAVLEGMKEGVAGLPAIRGVERTHPSASAVFYRKAPLLLAQLEQRIGSDAFDDLLYAVVEEEVATTSGWIGLLADLEGDEVADWFDREMDR